MNLRNIFTALFCLSNVLVFGQFQNVISAAGNTFETNSGSISFTIGECITTINADNMFLSPGFQQSKIQIVDIPKQIYSDYAIKVYPNPAGEFVILKVEKQQSIKYKLFDMNGRVLLLGEIVNNESEINLTELTPSMYILKVYRGDDETASYKIIKR